jgi:dTDP-4-dehydrorhamnose 3,5-epimerase
MRFQETEFKGCYLIDFDNNEDHRGSLNRIFCQKILLPLLKNKSIRQINSKFTRKEGAVRGLHFQNLSFAEIKIASCIKEEVWDVAVDMQKKISNFFAVLHGKSI